MKKIIKIVLVLFVTLTLGACGSSEEKDTNKPTKTEEKSRNPVIAKVGDCIREGYAWLKAEGLNCTLEWNQGGHFKEPMTRTARAFAWAMQQSKNESRVEKEHL